MTFSENFARAKSGHYYTCGNVAAFFDAAGELRIVGRSIKYYNVPCSFDIETTSHMYGNIPCGIMYCWSFCLNGACVFGRTYDEFIQLITAIEEHYRLSTSRRLRVYVRNLGFEFQFIRKWFEWSSVYARQPRTPMEAVTTDGLEFRCSMVLTNQKLSATAEDLIAHKIQKLTGELDYRQARHYATPMTEREIQYSLNDVLIDAALIYDRIQSDGNIARIPLTSTGYVRRLCRSRCLPARTKARWDYARQIARLTLGEDEYYCALAGFAGGFVHASPACSGQVQYNDASLDFTSAYPAEMVARPEYPISKGLEVDCRGITSRDMLIRWAHDYAFIGTFEFTDIDSKFDFDYYLSSSKVEKKSAEDMQTFNGRIVSAHKICIALTHIDFLTVLDTYDIAQIRVLRLWKYRKGYLPKEYILTVLDQYGKKTTLKGVAGKEDEYQQGKRNTNSLYGMLVTQLNRPEVIYDQETGMWKVGEVDTAAALDKYNNDDGRFLSYLWGIMVTALCRRHLWLAILECKFDYHYSDTDSVKIGNYEQHKHWFEQYNKDVDDAMRTAAQVVGFDYMLTRPKTIKGKEKPLGAWDYEGCYTRAKYMNAKRYIYEQNGELHVTIAGTGKHSTAKWLLNKYGSIDAVFENWTEDIIIDGEWIENGVDMGGTGKLTHIYNDNEIEFDLTDYTGRTAHVHELSSIYLTPCDYTMSFPAAFSKFVRELQMNALPTAQIMA